MALEQEAWIRRLKARDEAALNELVAQFSVPLGRYLLGMVRHSGEAEELAQETFVRFLSHLDEFRGDASPKTFLFKIATNLALNHLDSAARRREVFTGELPERVSLTHSPFEGVARSEEAAAVREALGSLPPQQRAVVVLRAWEDLSFREIASALGIAEGTAKAHHFFALRSLRRGLEARREP
jgi:RNA polymerase sigma-70 factor (ECF subfamily)